MDKIQLLIKQTEDAYKWTHKLVSTIPVDAWKETPKIIASNISWQIGHLILSEYYHSILVTVGHQQDILAQIPLKEYTKLFSFNTNPEANINSTNPKELLAHLSIVEKKSIEVLQSLTEEDLKDDLVPGGMKHPVAKNKYEAIDWNIKHTMWHCGQIAIIKRIINEPYNFVSGNS